MKWPLIALIVLMNVAFAQENQRHMVSINPSGLGWSTSLENMSTKSNSAFDGIKDLTQNIAFNYAYRITERQQLGLFGHFGNSEQEFDRRHGGDSKSEREYSSMGVFVLHNFSSDLSEAYYAGLSVSYINIEEEISADFSTEEGKVPMETDDHIYSTELVFGKRFSLKRWNIQNIVYAPQVNLFYRTHGKDFKDQGVRHGFGGVAQPIKFDVLF